MKWIKENALARFLKEKYTGVINKRVQNKYKNIPSFPFLVSFPRTGSHWLRMMMELYFEKPTLVRPFYYDKSDEFLCYHVHDIEQKLERDNVIYLYRKPSDVVYSQMIYHEEDLGNKIRVKYWATVYGLHLEKWLIKETFTKRKLIIKYEKLKNDLGNEFQKIVNFYDYEFDAGRLDDIAQKVSKEEVKRKTSHDKKVINRKDNYQQLKNRFLKSNSKLLTESVLSVNSDLNRFFIFKSNE
jgi:hypothetical protein